MALKSNGTRVQMHHISGNQLLMESTRNELAAQAEDGFPTIRITQRMRLQNPHMICMLFKIEKMGRVSGIQRKDKIWLFFRFIPIIFSCLQ